MTAITHWATIVTVAAMAGALGALGALAGAAVLARWLGHNPGHEIERQRRLLNTTILISRKGDHAIGPMTLENVALAAKYGGDGTTDWLEGIDGWSLFVVYDLINQSGWKGWPDE